MTDNRSSTGASGASSRQRAVEAYDNARESVAGSVAEAPLIAIAGGLAAGALIAALLPRTEAEDRLIQPTARRVRDSARAAAEAARTTGAQRAEELGLTRDRGQDVIRSLLDNVSEVAKVSAKAAADAAKNAS